jgi:hypothetical protein
MHWNAHYRTLATVYRSPLTYFTLRGVVSFCGIETRASRHGAGFIDPSSEAGGTLFFI